ncbi:hypothetical protein ACQ4M4_24055 [Leptolyngbya sp. AN02str]|uniref:hypothetical protein n=1 Tax=Leptolyngbya sp. AN02str TaxID=3423363 RepID=UPI003D31357D
MNDWLFTQSRWLLWQQAALAGLSSLAALGAIAPSHALPPPEDIPEEVLRTQIILEGRSPIDGEALTAQEYAEQQAAIQVVLNAPGELSPEVREVIFLLSLRKGLRIFFPFIP